MQASAPSDQYLCAFILCVLLIFFLYFEQFLDFRFTRRPYCLFIIVCYRSAVGASIRQFLSREAVAAGIAKVVVQVIFTPTLKTAAQQANEQLANGEITQQQYDALQREIVETEQNLRSLQDQAATRLGRLIAASITLMCFRVMLSCYEQYIGSASSEQR